MNNSYKKNPIKSRFVDNPAPTEYVDTDNLAKLFALIEQGNIGKCKDFLLGMSLDLNEILDGKIILNSLINVNPIKLSENKKVEFIDYLVDNKDVYINSYDDDGLTPLHCAVKGGYYKIVDYLVNKQANVDAQSDNGLTPLHYATLLTLKDCPKDNMPKELIERDRNVKSKTNDITKELIKIFFKKKDDINNGNVTTNLYTQFITDMDKTYNMYHMFGKELTLAMDISKNLIDKMKNDMTTPELNTLVNDFLDKLLKEANDKLEYPSKVIENMDMNDAPVNQYFYVERNRDLSYNEIMKEAHSDLFDDLEDDYQTGFGNYLKTMETEFEEFIKEKLPMVNEWKNRYRLSYTESELKEILKFALMKDDFKKKIVNLYNKAESDGDDEGENRLNKLLPSVKYGDAINCNDNRVRDIKFPNNIEVDGNDVVANTELKNNTNNTEKYINYMLYNLNLSPEKYDNNDIQQEILQKIIDNDGKITINNEDVIFAVNMMNIYSSISEHYNIVKHYYFTILNNITRTSDYIKFAVAINTEFIDITNGGNKIITDDGVIISYNDVHIIVPAPGNKNINDLYGKDALITLHHVLYYGTQEDIIRYLVTHFTNMMSIKTYMIMICIKHNVDDLKPIIESSKDNLLTTFVQTLERIIYNDLRKFKTVTFPTLKVDSNNLQRDIIQRLINIEKITGFDITKFDVNNVETSIDDYFNNYKIIKTLNFPTSTYNEIYDNWSSMIKQDNIDETMLKNYNNMNKSFKADFESMNKTSTECIDIVSKFYGFLITFFKRYFYDNQHFNTHGFNGGYILNTIVMCVKNNNFRDLQYNVGVNTNNKLEDYINEYDNYMLREYNNNNPIVANIYPIIVNDENTNINIHLRNDNLWNNLTNAGNANKTNINGQLSGPDAAPGAAPAIVPAVQLAANGQQANSNSLYMASEFIDKALEYTYSNSKKQGIYTRDFIKKLVLNINENFTNINNYNNIIGDSVIPRAGVAGANLVFTLGIGLGGILQNDRPFYTLFRNPSKYLSAINTKITKALVSDVKIQLRYILEPVSDAGKLALQNNPFGMLYDSGDGDGRGSIGINYTDEIVRNNGRNATRPSQALQALQAVAQAVAQARAQAGVQAGAQAVAQAGAQAGAQVIAQLQARAQAQAQALEQFQRGGAQVQNYYESLFYIRYNSGQPYSYKGQPHLLAEVNDKAICTVVDYDSNNTLHVNFNNIDTLQINYLHNAKHVVLNNANGKEKIYINHLNLLVNLLVEIKDKIQNLYISDTTNENIEEFKSYYKYYHHLALFTYSYEMMIEKPIKENLELMEEELKILQKEQLNLDINDADIQIYTDITNDIIEIQRDFIKTSYNIIHDYTDDCVKQMDIFGKIDLAIPHMKSNHNITLFQSDINDITKDEFTYDDDVRITNENINIKGNIKAVETEFGKYFNIFDIIKIKEESKLEHIIQICKDLHIVDVGNVADDDVEMSTIRQKLDNIKNNEDHEKYYENFKETYENGLETYIKAIFKDRAIYGDITNIDYRITNNYDGKTIDKKDIHITDMIDKDFIKEIIDWMYKDTIVKYKLLNNVMNPIDLGKIHIDLKKDILNDHMRNIYEEFATTYINKNMNNIFINMLNEQIKNKSTVIVTKIPVITIEPEEYAIQPNAIKSKLKSVLTDGVHINEDDSSNIKLIEDEDYDIFGIAEDRIKIKGKGKDKNTFIFYSYDYYNKHDELQCVHINDNIIKRLIRGNADVNARDSNNKTIIDYLIEGRMYYLLEKEDIKNSCRMSSSIHTMLKYELNHNRLLFDEDTDTGKRINSFIDNHQQEFIDRLRMTENIKQNIPINLRYIFHAFMTMQNIHWFRMLNKEHHGDSKWVDVWVEYRDLFGMPTDKLAVKYDWKLVLNIKIKNEKILGKEQEKINENIKRTSGQIHNRDPKYKDTEKTNIDIGNREYRTESDDINNDADIPDPSTRNKIFAYLDNIMLKLNKDLDPKYYTPTNYSYIWKNLSENITEKDFMIHYVLVNKYNEMLKELQITDTDIPSYKSEDIDKLVNECKTLNDLFVPISKYIDDRMIPYVYDDNMMFKFVAQSIVHILSSFLGSNMYMLIRRILKIEIDKIRQGETPVTEEQLTKILKPLNKYVTNTTCEKGFLSYDFLKAHMIFKKDDEDEDELKPTNKLFDKLTDKLEGLGEYGIDKKNKMLEKINISIGRYYLTLYQETTNSLLDFSDGYQRMVKNQLLGIKFIAKLELPTGP